MFGYGFALSDVRVTLGDGREIDCLQKIHPVGQWVAAGFAGSVQIGFAMIDTLKSFLRLDGLDVAWDPLSLAQCWTAPTREMFAGFPLEARQHGCHLMLVSTHPQEHGGNPAWPRSYVHIFKSPDFEPEPVMIHRLGSIGCGEAYHPCRRAIERYSNNLEGQDILTQGEIGASGGMGSRLGMGLTDVLMQAQPGGISSHLHYCWVYRGQIIIQPNDHTRMGRWSMWKHGSGVGQDPAGQNDPAPSIPPSDVQPISGSVFRMPQIATTWEELCQMLESHDLNVDGCIA